MLAFERAGLPYVRQTSWNINEIYDESVCKNLVELWGDDLLYRMPVLDTKIPHMLNVLMARPDMEIFFVTD